jgi:hypothetical protein
VTAIAFEQRNPYKGSPPRPWIRIRLTAPDGTAQEIELLADTGNPFELIVSQQQMAVLGHGTGPSLNTNFGQLNGGWFQLAMPELGLSQSVFGYASDTVVNAAKASHPDFAGLAGLPLLRLLEYGGDADWFWIRRVTNVP